jgi:hypothetical protein
MKHVRIPSHIPNSVIREAVEAHLLSSIISWKGRHGTVDRSQIDGAIGSRSARAPISVKSEKTGKILQFKYSSADYDRSDEDIAGWNYVAETPGEVFYLLVINT